jgi:hypothetical protein
MNCGVKWRANLDIDPLMLGIKPKASCIPKPKLPTELEPQPFNLTIKSSVVKTSSNPKASLLFNYVKTSSLVR